MTAPIESKCAGCGRIAAETVCSLCKVERPESIEIRRLSEERQANNYANDRIKADKIAPPYNTDGDYSVFGGRLRLGR